MAVKNDVNVNTAWLFCYFLFAIAFTKADQEASFEDPIVFFWKIKIVYDYVNILHSFLFCNSLQGDMYCG